MICLSVSFYEKSLVIIFRSEEQGNILAHSASATSSIYESLIGMFKFDQRGCKYKVQLELLSRFLPDDFEPNMICGDIIGIARL